MTKTSVLLAAFLATGGGAYAQGHSHGGAMAPPAQPKAVPPPKVFTDSDFIDLTATRGEAALKLSRLAEQKAQDPQLRAVAADVSQALQRDIDYLAHLRGLFPNGHRAAAMADMNSVARTADGSEHLARDGRAGSDSPSAAGQTVETTAQPDRLAALSGPEFDRAVAAAILEHYQVTLPAAERAATDATRDEIRAFARAGVAAQRKVIGQLSPFVGGVR